MDLCSRLSPIVVWKKKNFVSDLKKTALTGVSSDGFFIYAFFLDDLNTVALRILIDT